MACRVVVGSKRNYYLFLLALKRDVKWKKSLSIICKCRRKKRIYVFVLLNYLECKARLSEQAEFAFRFTANKGNINWDDRLTHPGRVEASQPTSWMRYNASRLFILLAVSWWGMNPNRWGFLPLTCSTFSVRWRVIEVSILDSVETEDIQISQQHDH